MSMLSSPHSGQDHRQQHPRLLRWWVDDPADPGRLPLDDPEVQRLITAIAPGAHVVDLGGVMSLNIRLEPKGLVLRVHQPFVSRARLRALQEIRQQLAGNGLAIPVPLRRHNTTLWRCRNRWAELEPYLPHERLAPTLDAYVWLFKAMGTLHRALATLDLEAPRPVIATYAPPSSLRRWLAVTAAAVREDPGMTGTVHFLDSLVRQLRRQWVPETRLPRQFVHGDVRLSNVCRARDGQTVYFDFGFLAERPRIHELAYALAFMVLALDVHRDPQHFPWHAVPRLVDAYETAAQSRLTPLERQALAPYTAAVPIYFAALAGCNEHPVEQLRSKLPFLRLSKWLLGHPNVLM